MKRRFPSDLGKHLGIWLIMGLQLFPLYILLEISLKSNKQFYANPWFPSWPHEWALDNYAFAFRTVAPYLINSLIVAVAVTVGAVAFALLAAYFFARRPMPGASILWAALMFIMLLPSVANIVAVFSLLKSLSLLNTLWALIVLGIAGAQVFCVYILRNFIEEIPRDLFEAAEIDGAGHLRQIISIVIPLSGPILATLGVLQFLSSWNDFLMPLIVLRDKNLFTIGVGLIYLDGEYVKNWGRIMAAFVSSSIPLVVIFCFSMKMFVRGIGSGAIK